jgi:hypothetical protein
VGCLKNVVASGSRRRPGALRDGLTVAPPTLGLGIGANATLFGIVDRLLLREPQYLASAERVGPVYLKLTIPRG